MRRNTSFFGIPENLNAMPGRRTFRRTVQLTNGFGEYHVTEIGLLLF
jgi:hypothetical protein